MPAAQTTPAPPVDHALYYAQLGYRVLPIKPGGKHPPIPAWQDAATCDPDTIRAWYDGLYRNHGVGIATGHLADGTPFFVLDVDNGPGKDGDEELADLTRQHGPLPDTITSLTGNNGYHYFLATPPGVDCPRNNQSGTLAPSLDIRGEGGQVVTAPTIHPNGRPYTWEAGHGPGEIEMATAPGWLVGLLEAPTRKPAATHPTMRTKPATSDPFIVATDDGPAQRYNERTTWHDLLTADNWTLSHTDTDNEQHWTRPGKTKREGTSATVGYKGGDALKVFTSSVPWLDADRAYSRFGYYAARHHTGDRSAAARELLRLEQPAVTPLTVIPVGTPPDNPHQSETASIPDGEEVSTPTVPDVDAALLAMLIDWPTFWARDATDAEWLAEPVIAAGRAHAIYAPGGTGKSLFALWLAAQLATGGPGLNRQHLAPRRVLYLDYEMTHDDVQERLETMGYDTATNFTNFHYALLPTLAPADKPDGGKQIGRLAQLVDAELVVLDTFGRAVVGDENEADTIRDFYRWTAMHLKAEGRALVRIDHAGKDIDKGQRGSSAKNDDVDVVWQMIRAEGGFTLTAKKRRMGWVPETVDLRQHDEPTLHYSITSGSVPAGTKTVIDLLERLGIPAGTSFRVSRRMMKEAGHSATNVVLAAAVKNRRNADLGLGTPLGTRSEWSDNHSVGTVGNTPTNTTSNHTEHFTEHLGTLDDANAEQCPSLERGTVPQRDPNHHPKPPQSEPTTMQPGDVPW